MNRVEIDMNAAPLQEQLPKDAPPVGFPYEGHIITNPWVSEDAREPVTPIYYGFATKDTGGGCTAWEHVVVIDDEEWEYLITDLHDGNAPMRGEAMDHGWQLGGYVDGEQRWSLYVCPDATGWVDYPAGARLSNTDRARLRAAGSALSTEEKEALRYTWGGMGDGYASDILGCLWDAAPARLEPGLVVVVYHTNEWRPGPPDPTDIEGLAVLKSRRGSVDGGESWDVRFIHNKPGLFRRWVHPDDVVA